MAIEEEILDLRLRDQERSR